ncbi:GNAT family acetyltraansferase [Devosia geojensis]|uniref:GNAT family acetyltraansferase n=1 Tax=Devosia geojensis TaxID=443610 RepID=A0A0F5FJZ1_9HYPH|nr:GNAT family N-acetyltransferase [Devosia geojensis]KKB08517.1 GNAT family acetyltraansferase [Devosia geojensis]
MQNEIDWLDADFRTLFRLTQDDRIEHENDPDLSTAPRLWLGGCAEGNIVGVRADVADDVARELEALAADEPPFLHPETPVHFERYLAVLAEHRPVERHNFGMVYTLPNELPDPGAARLIGSDTPEGAALLQSLVKDGMPSGLCELGFRDTADFWPPWCAALVDGEIASIAFAARLSEVGAELGLATAKAFRGRGMGAAATAGWSRLRPLQSRTLFYSTDRNNSSSQRVAERLGLRLRGATLRIT